MDQESNGTCKRAIERSDDASKTLRHPRWTRHETLVLIEGKRLAEERGRTGRRTGSVFGSDQVEAKWDYVSSHCRRNRVNRGPIQCRKRWSNLLSDFKKIRTWDSCLESEGESFWTMRSVFRRDRKLPGFFDREIYDVLDGKGFTGAAYQLALVTVGGCGNNEGGVDDEDEMVENEEGGDIPFSEFKEEEIGMSSGKVRVQTDDEANAIPSPVPISELKFQPFHHENSKQGTGKKNVPRDPEFRQGAKKRKHSSSDHLNIDVETVLIKALQRNNDLLNSQLEEQKHNLELAREQHERIITALTKITGALEKIADKL